jgi:putative transcriptional regulator
MTKELFNQLIESVRQAGRIRRGEQKPSRKFAFKREDIRKIRRRLEKSQS